MRMLATTIVAGGLGFSAAAAERLPKELQDCVVRDPKRAIEFCSEFIEHGAQKQQHLAIAYNNRGNARFMQSQYKRAIADYKAAIKVSPRYANPHNNLGLVYHRQGRYEKAIEEFDKAIELNPKYANAYNNRGYSYQRLKKIREAIEDYRKALKINPKHVNAKANLRRLLAQGIDI